MNRIFRLYHDFMQFSKISYSPVDLLRDLRHSNSMSQLIFLQNVSRN